MEPSHVEIAARNVLEQLDRIVLGRKPMLTFVIGEEAPYSRLLVTHDIFAAMAKHVRTHRKDYALAAVGGEMMTLRLADKARAGDIPSAVLTASDRSARDDRLPVSAASTRRRTSSRGRNGRAPPGRR
jgi:hypothetical protein